MASKSKITQIIFETTIKKKTSKDETAQKIITSKTNKKTSKNRKSNVSSWDQYDTIQTISEVNNEVWTFNDMENALPSTCQYKIKSAANANIEEKFIIPQQISASNTGNWNTEGCEITENWESTKNCKITEDWVTTEDWPYTDEKKNTCSKIGDLAPNWMNDFRQVERVKKLNENVGRIFGNWKCSTEKLENETVLLGCKYEWKELIVQESLIKYLEKDLVEQREFFRKECNRCHKRERLRVFACYLPSGMEQALQSVWRLEMFELSKKMGKRLYMDVPSKVYG
ncbi:9222_t:CDS:10 [Entrophospora sp. SA101]|nr:9222_t:CDS:10 [Entrophospora sp. SA101]